MLMESLLRIDLGVQDIAAALESDFENELLKTMILLLGVASSVLAHYEMLAYVMVATAAATAVTSWSEFSEDARKVSISI